ncbi:MAG TPA: hypothetical protein VHW44_28680 [Pseudonocardiaceae bacterium]|nr:hypothetical protein [Pseudonocardiaceae bacterium]
MLGVRADLLGRGGRGRCPQLDRVLAGTPVFGADLRDRISRHVDGEPAATPCPTCLELCRELVEPYREPLVRTLFSVDFGGRVAEVARAAVRSAATPRSPGRVLMVLAVVVVLAVVATLVLVVERGPGSTAALAALPAPVAGVTRPTVTAPAAVPTTAPYSGVVVTTPASSHVVGEFYAAALRTADHPSAALCGATAPDLAVVGAPSAANTVTVTLFEAGAISQQQPVVTVDPGSSTITSFYCRPTITPDYPGLPALLSWYRPGTEPGQVAGDGPIPELDVTADSCVRTGPASYVFYAPVATSSGQVWRFTTGDQQTQPGQGDPELFTDTASGQVRRVLCDAFPVLPAPVGPPIRTGGNDPVTGLVDQLYRAYLSERAQLNLGARPTDETEPYFDSAAAYATALAGSGRIPFLCAGMAPTFVAGTPVAVDGSTETVSVVSSMGPVGSRVGAATVAVDLRTMKIAGITCS